VREHDRAVPSGECRTLPTVCGASPSQCYVAPVPDSAAETERLSDRQYVVLLLRLLINADGDIVYGDAGGPEEHDPTVERWVHFRGPDGLLDAVRRWLVTRTGAADTPSQHNTQKGSEAS